MRETATMTLTEFVRARLAEKEAKARESAADAMAGWRWTHYPKDAYEEIQSLVLNQAKWDLADVEAKRRIVELHGGDFDAECHEDGYGLPRPDDCPTLRALALPFADHPDYRESWRP